MIEYCTSDKTGLFPRGDDKKNGCSLSLHFPNNVFVFSNIIGEYLI